MAKRFSGLYLLAATVAQRPTGPQPITIAVLLFSFEDAK